MQKDFEQWNKDKQRLDTSEENKLYYERQIWWCSLGVNIGFEQDGTGKEHQHPVLILNGMSRTTCYVIPLTTSAKEHKHRIHIGEVEGKQTAALMSQMRLIDTKRLVNKIGFLDKEIFAIVRKAAKDIL